jgi:hypothetical protein
MNKIDKNNEGLLLLIVVSLNDSDSAWIRGASILYHATERATASLMVTYVFLAKELYDNIIQPGKLISCHAVGPEIDTLCVHLFRSI